MHNRIRQYRLTLTGRVYALPSKPKMDKIINIVGKAPGYGDAPYEGEVWGATQLIIYRWVSRVIDMNDYSDNKWGLDERYLADLARKKAEETNTPYMDLENYPLDEIIEFFGTDFFTNTIDYMLALAIYEGATEINIYGVAMSTSVEYQYQRPGLHFWIGYAMGKGIKVRVKGKDCTLLRADLGRYEIMRPQNGLLYGYEIPQRIDRSK